jgi:hypothetical protein
MDSVVRTPKPSCESLPAASVRRASVPLLITECPTDSAKLQVPPSVGLLVPHRVRGARLGPHPR